MEKVGVINTYLNFKLCLFIIYQNNELKSEDYPSIFAKDISKTISPPINFKMLTAGSAREPNTRDQSNKKAVQFDTSTYTIPEERTRLNTSHVSESIKSRS